MPNNGNDSPRSVSGDEEEGAYFVRQQSLDLAASYGTYNQSSEMPVSSYDGQNAAYSTIAELAPGHRSYDSVEESEKEVSRSTTFGKETPLGVVRQLSEVNTDVYHQDEPEKYMRSLTKQLKKSGSTVSVLSSVNDAAKNEAGQSTKQDWNDRFQSILEMSEDSGEEVFIKYKAMAKLSRDFVQLAKMYGRIIISEHRLPDSEKTIKPTDIGGRAGGLKYIIRGILFKLSEDQMGSQDKNGNPIHIYGGSIGSDYELAMKGAAHELKGATSYLNYFLTLTEADSAALSSSTPRVPMMALITFRGFRLTAMPILPLSKLVYGSADGGATVYSEDPSGFLRGAARFLHLAGHSVFGKELYAAGDVEMHKGKDSRTYLLDLARTFPCESANVCTHLPRIGQTQFYRMFRPEFLARLRQMGHPPLSPDALTGWSRGQGDAAEHNQNIINATRLLLEEVAAFAREIDQVETVVHQDAEQEHKRAEEKGAESGHAQVRRIDGNKSGEEELTEQNNARLTLTVPVSEKVHRRGINVRHIGLLRSSIVHNQSARDTLFIEVVARTLKNLLRSWLRGAMAEFDVNGEEPSEFEIQNRVSLFLNLVSGSHLNSDFFWKSIVRPGIFQRFGACSLNDSEKENLKAAARPFLLSIINHCLSMVGIDLTHSCRTDLNSSADVFGFHFTDTDLGQADVRVKHMSLLDYANGRLLLERSNEILNASPATAAASSISSSSLVDLASGKGVGVNLDSTADARLRALAVREFASALRSDTLNLRALRDKLSAEALEYELRGDFEGSDLVLITNVFECVATSQHNPALWGQIVAPLCSALFQRWRSRRTASKKVGAKLENFGGASSINALAKLDGIVTLGESQSNDGDGDGGSGSESMVGLRGELSLIQKMRSSCVEGAFKTLSKQFFEKASGDSVGSDRKVVLASCVERYLAFTNPSSVAGRAKTPHNEAIATAQHEALAVINLLTGKEAPVAPTEGMASPMKVREAKKFLIAVVEAVLKDTKMPGGCLGVLQELYTMLYPLGPDSTPTQRAALLREEALLDATKDGNMDLMKGLLRYHTRVNAFRFGDSETALMVACRAGNFKAVKLLLDFGADPRARTPSKGEFALFSAVEGSGPDKHKIVTHLLKECRVDPNEMNARGEFSLLMAAANKTDTKTVKILLEHGADPCLQSESGWNPLSLATGTGNEGVVETLLGAGADPNLRDGRGMSSFVYAGRSKDDRLLGLLLAHSLVEPKLDFPTRHGMTALMYASKNGVISIVERLLKEGVDPRLISNDGESAYDLAAKEGHENVAKALEKAILKYDDGEAFLQRTGRHATLRSEDEDEQKKKKPATCGCF